MDEKRRVVSGFTRYLVHDACGWFKAPSFGHVWFTNRAYDGVCPRCGAEMPDDNLHVRGEWRLITARLVKVRTGFLRWRTELEEQG